MVHKHNIPGAGFVFVDETGYLQLYTENGERVPINIFIRVQDNMDAPTYAICKFQINLVANKEEMLSEIEKFKKSSWND